MTHNGKLLSIINAVNEYADHLRDHHASDIANKLREITNAHQKEWDDDDLAQLIRMGTEAYDRELAARGAQPRVVNVIVATLDYLSEHDCTWESLDLERLASDIEEKYT